MDVTSDVLIHQTEKCYILIDKIREQPVLYNYNLPSYRDRAVRQQCWEKIGKDLRITGEAAKITWDKLRRSFSNALHRRRIRSYNQSDRLSQPWKYEQNMSFLLPFTEQGKIRDHFKEEIGNKKTEVDGRTLISDHDSFRSISDDSEDGLSERNLTESFSPLIIKRELSESPDREISIEKISEQHNYTNGYIPKLRDLHTSSSRLKVSKYSSLKNTSNIGGSMENLMIEQANLRESLDGNCYTEETGTIKLTRKDVPHCESHNMSIHHSRTEESNKRRRIQSDLDETDMFFLSLAKTTKKLPLIDQAEIKMLLSNAIFQAQIRQLMQPTNSQNGDDSGNIENN